MLALMLVLMFSMSRAPAGRPARPSGPSGAGVRDGVSWVAGLEDRRSSGKSQLHLCLLGDNAHKANSGSSKVVLEWFGLQISCAWTENIVLMEK